MVNCCCYDIGTDIFSLEQQETAMFKKFLRKQNQVQVLILKYLEDLKMTQENFSLALESCLTDDKACGDFSFLSDETHRFESRADDVREQIKTLMYDKTLLPESRGDIMRLLDGMDYIPRYMEIILNMIKTQMLEIPDFIVADIRELLSASLESVGLMKLQLKELVIYLGEISDHVDTLSKQINIMNLKRRV
jgi:uncharacterized protein Yka (UPF0111/DUF47 family)